MLTFLTILILVRLLMCQNLPLDTPKVVSAEAEGRLPIRMNREAYFPKFLLKIDNYVFVACENDVTHLKCNVHHAKLRSGVGLFTERICSFEKKLQNSISELSKFHPLSLDLILGNENMTIISWVEWNSARAIMYQRVSTLNISNCKTKDLQFASSDEYLQSLTIGNIVPHTSTFDVFTQDHNKCASWDKCVLSYNDRNSLKAITRFEIPAPHFTIVPISPFSLKGGFFAYTNSNSLNGTLSSLVIYYQSPSTESMISLGEFTSGTIKKKPITSNSNRMFTICTEQMIMLNDIQNTVIRCGQFRLESGDIISENKKINMTESFHGTKAFAIYNLKDGGFLMMMLGSNGTLYPLNKTFTLYVVQQSKNNQYKMTLLHEESSNLACRENFDNVKIIASDFDDEYCFHFLCALKVEKKTGAWKQSVYVKKRCYFKNFVTAGVPV
ncbi:hypothetical protein QAD02_016984 [Eretmocerus hayati]|uniref:Uncharacterized protein n=1 Tax=Eretmocerus hayati TaxID=131215 RepID=A0ACC2PCM9_9HYME|nr:hypothetical protein QAD02_016984 [Eretmocerus hayati]